MSTPSGFCDGTSMMLVLSRIVLVSRSLPRARRSARTIGVVKPPDSLEWIADVTRMTSFPSSISFCRSLAEPRIHEPALDLPIVLEIGEGAGVGDEGDDERPAERRLAERAHADPRTRLVERGEVVDDLLPAREVTIGARLEAEDGSRGGDGGALRARRAGGREEDCGGGEERFAHDESGGGDTRRY